MSTKLGNEEYKITSLIISNAIAHAAQSLSKLLKDEVKLFKLDLIDQLAYQVTLPDINEGKECYLLKTTIFGDIRAISNLIVNDIDAERIWQITQPENIPMQQEMQEAILMEMDNILTAAVVSEIANILQVSVFGGVPGLQKIPSSEAMSVILPDEEGYDYQFILKTSFICKTTEINPSFVWFFQRELLDNVKQIIKRPEDYPGIAKIKDYLPNHSE